MYLKQMLPGQIHEAAETDWPVLLPIGCVECHGYHLPVGCDTLIVEEVVRRLERRIGCVVAPTVDYGPTGYAVSGPELGTIDVSYEQLLPYARAVLEGLVALGLRRIIVLVFHQGENGQLATSFRLAGMRIMDEAARREQGNGWWGAKGPEERAPVPCSISVRCVVHPQSSPPAGGDHAGINETSYMLAACGHAVDMSRLREDKPWYTVGEGRRAADGSVERGERMFEAMVNAWAEELGKRR